MMTNAGHNVIWEMHMCEEPIYAGRCRRTHRGQTQVSVPHALQRADSARSYVMLCYGLYSTKRGEISKPVAYDLENENKENEVNIGIETQEIT